MWFLALELWPYLLAALALGVATGWLSGCVPRHLVGTDAAPAAEAAEGTP